jgi:hypothetical protein
LQTDVFNPAVHDSDVSGTTITANTNTVTDSQTFAIAMATVGDDTKGKDIMLLHVEPLSSWTSYMLLITVSSKPQLNAVLARMEKEAEAVWHRPRTHKSPGRCVLLQLLWLLDSSASALLSNGYHGTTHWQLLEVLLLVYEHLWAIEAAACKVSFHADDSFPGTYLLRVQMLSWSELPIT